MQDRHRGNEYRTTVVCVDSYHDGVPAGRFYNPQRPQGVVFQSMVQFLAGMEDMLDEMRYPQSFVAARSFSDSAEECAASPAAEGGEQSGKVATFAVRVLFRQNASWQGSVAWLEGGREERFRSVLELILLMDSAMRNG